MTAPPAGPLPADVQRHLATASLGRRLYFYPETDSTNDVALELARRGEPDGTVVVADFQRRGRGRRSHAWASPPGRDLLFSLILRPQGDARAALPVSLVVAHAIAVAVSKLTDVDLFVKWPNDVVARDGKLAGILAEGVSGGGALSTLVVGVGINVNTRTDDFPGTLRGAAASCMTLTGVEWDRAWLLADVLGAIESYYDRFRRDGFAALVSAYEGRLWQRGKRVAFERDGARPTGVALGVSREGALRVRLDADTREIDLYSELIEVIE